MKPNRPFRRFRLLVFAVALIAGSFACCRLLQSSYNAGPPRNGHIVVAVASDEGTASGMVGFNITNMASVPLCFVPDSFISTEETALGNRILKSHVKTNLVLAPEEYGKVRVNSLTNEVVWRLHFMVTTVPSTKNRRWPAILQRLLDLRPRENWMFEVESPKMALGEPISNNVEIADLKMVFMYHDID